MDLGSGCFGATSVCGLRGVSGFGAALSGLGYRIQSRHDFGDRKDDNALHNHDYRSDLEKVVFGQYLLAPAFFWEDVFSFAVIALHTAYIVALWTGSVSTNALMLLALVAYANYVINAGQFIWKLRLARLDMTQRDRAMTEAVSA